MADKDFYFFDITPIDEITLKAIIFCAKRNKSNIYIRLYSYCPLYNQLDFIFTTIYEAIDYYKEDINDDNDDENETEDEGLDLTNILEINTYSNNKTVGDYIYMFYEILSRIDPDFYSTYDENFIYQVLEMREEGDFLKKMSPKVKKEINDQYNYYRQRLSSLLNRFRKISPKSKIICYLPPDF